MGEITGTDRKPRSVRRAVGAEAPLWSLERAGLPPGGIRAQAPPCFLGNLQKLDWAGELPSAQWRPMLPPCPAVFSRSWGTYYLWFLAYVFRLSDCERLVSMRFCFFPQRPGPLTFKIVPMPVFTFWYRSCFISFAHCLFCSPQFFSQAESILSDIAKQLILILVNGLLWFLLQGDFSTNSHILFSQQIGKYVPHSLCCVCRACYFVTHCLFSFICFLCHCRSFPNTSSFMQTPSSELDLAVEFA